MYNKEALEKTKSAVSELERSFSHIWDLHRIPALFDAIASCIMDLEEFDESKKEEAPPLYEVLKVIAAKDLIDAKASGLASELEDFSDIIGYDGEFDEEVYSAEVRRARLFEFLQAYLKLVESKL